MTDILRFPGAWQRQERSVHSRAVGAIIAHSVDAVIQAVREKRLKINLQLDSDIAASTVQVGFSEAMANVLAEAANRAPVGSTIDILGSQSDGTTEIEVSDQGDASPVSVNNAMSRPFESGAIVRQVVRLPQGGTSAILRICKENEAVGHSANSQSHSHAATIRKAA